jgi:hypothetical protein
MLIIVWFADQIIQKNIKQDRLEHHVKYLCISLTPVIQDPTVYTYNEQDNTQEKGGYPLAESIEKKELMSDKKTERERFKKYQMKSKQADEPAHYYRIKSTMKRWERYATTEFHCLKQIRRIITTCTYPDVEQ